MGDEKEDALFERMVGTLERYVNNFVKIKKLRERRMFKKAVIVEIDIKKQHHIINEDQENTFNVLYKIISHVLKNVDKELLSEVTYRYMKNKKLIKN